MRITDENVGLLVESGIPEPLAQDLRNQPGLSGVQYGLEGGTFIVLMLVLMGVPFLMMSPAFTQLLAGLGVFPEDAFLVQIGFGSMIVAMFSGIFLAGWIVGGVISWFPDFERKTSLTSMASMVDPNQQYRGAQRGLLRAVARRVLKKTSEPEGFLTGFNQVAVRFAGTTALVLYLIAAGVFFWDLHSMSYVTPDKVSNGRYFSVEQKEYGWEDASKLLTGCGYVNEDDSILFYEVEFEDGSVLNLRHHTFHPLGLERMEAIELVDAILAEHSIPWEKMLYDSGSRKGKEQWSYTCFRKYREPLSSDDKARFDKLYRYTDGD